MNTNQSFDQKTGRTKFFDVMDQELQKLIDPSTQMVRSELTEKVTCPVCHQDSKDLAFQKQGFSFWRCHDCQLIYVNPQLSELRISEHYRESGESNRAWIDVLESDSNMAWQVPYFQDTLRSLERAGFPKGEILDVGCSTGLFLEVCRKAGYRDLLGIELDRAAREVAEQKRSLKVLNCFLDKENLGVDRFSVITLFGVLEHLANPKAFLARAYETLKPGGLLLCIVPNLHSLTNMVLREDARTFTGRNHLQYFSPPSLQKIVTLAGFEVKEISTVLEGYEALWNRLQYRSPFGAPEDAFLPPSMRDLISDPGRLATLTEWMHQNLLGLRVKVIARKPE